MTTETAWRAIPGTRWQDRAAAMLQDDAVGVDREGNPDPTDTDRRWLWRLEGRLAVGATNNRLRELQADLQEYLCETCDHQWDDPDGYHYFPPTDPATPKIRQCRWCSHVENVPS
jgi:hypothetical protein